MNTEQLLDQMGQLKLGGMQEALREQQSHPKHTDLDFEERLSLLLDRELLKRENNRVQNLHEPNSDNPHPLRIFVIKVSAD